VRRSGASASDFCRRWGIRPLFAVYRSVYGEVLMCRGEWEDAEAELVAATGDLIATVPARLARAWSGWPS
jgi:hypothetical protein